MEVAIKENKVWKFERNDLFYTSNQTSECATYISFCFIRSAFHPFSLSSILYSFLAVKSMKNLAIEGSPHAQLRCFGLLQYSANILNNLKLYNFYTVCKHLGHFLIFCKFCTKADRDLDEFLLVSKSFNQMRKPVPCIRQIAVILFGVSGNLIRYKRATVFDIVRKVWRARGSTRVCVR